MANDKWLSVNDVIDFRYFTVEKVIDYMEQLVQEPSRHIMIIQKPT